MRIIAIGLSVCVCVSLIAVILIHFLSFIDSDRLFNCRIVSSTRVCVYRFISISYIGLLNKNFHINDPTFSASSTIKFSQNWKIWKWLFDDLKWWLHLLVACKRQTCWWNFLYWRIWMFHDYMLCFRNIRFQLVVEHNSSSMAGFVEF